MVSKKIIEETFGVHYEKLLKKLETYALLNNELKGKFDLSPLLSCIDGVCTDVAFLQNKIRLPYWVNKILKSDISQLQISNFSFINQSYRRWSFIGAPFSNAIFYIDPSGMITLPDAFSIESWISNENDIYRPQEVLDKKFKIFRPEEFSQSIEYHFLFNEVLVKQVSFVVSTGKSYSLILKSHLSNRSFENKSFNFIMSIRPYTVERFVPIFKMNYVPEKSYLSVNDEYGVYFVPNPNIVCLSRDDSVVKRNLSISSDSGLAVGKFIYNINLPSMQTFDINLIIPLSRKASIDLNAISMYEDSYVQQWYELLKNITYIEMPYGEMQEFYYNSLASLISILNIDDIFSFKAFTNPSVLFDVLRALILYYNGPEITTSIINLLSLSSKEKIPKMFMPYILWLAIESINLGISKDFFDKILKAINSLIPKLVKFTESILTTDAISSLPLKKMYMLNHTTPDFEGGFLLAAVLYNLHLLQNEYGKDNFDLKSLSTRIYDHIKKSLHKIIDDSLNGSLDKAQYINEFVGFSTLIRAVIPIHLFDPYEPEIRDFIEYAWNNAFNENLFLRKLPPAGYDIPTTIDFMHYFLYSRETLKSLKIMNGIKSIYASPFGYPELIHPISKLGRFGEGYSILALSKMLQSTRDLLLFEDGDSLVFLSGAAQDLIKSPRITKIRMFKTYFGMSEIELGASKNQYHIDLSVERMPHNIEVSLPKDMPSTRLKVYGATITNVYPFERGEIIELETQQNNISLIAKRRY